MQWSITLFVWHTTMKNIPCLIFCLSLLFIFGSLAVPVAMAQPGAKEPLITLSVNDQPLGEVLDTITAETGYQFKLNSQWQDWPVSATIGNLPLEKGLKRLLRSLNHTIIWESERTVTIMVYGKAEPGSAGPAVSFAAPPQAEQEMSEPDLEPEDQTAEEESGEETDESESAESTDQEDSDAEKQPVQVGQPANILQPPGGAQPPAAAQPPKSPPVQE